MEFLPDLTPACKKGGAEEGNPSLTGLPLFARGGKAVEDVSASVSPLLRSPAYPDVFASASARRDVLPL